MTILRGIHPKFFLIDSLVCLLMFSFTEIFAWEENELNSEQPLGEKLIIERKRTQFSLMSFAIDNIKKTNYLFPRRNFAPIEKT